MIRFDMYLEKESLKELREMLKKPRWKECSIAELIRTAIFEFLEKEK